jgi:cytoskeletal protein RodZ
MKKDNLRVSIYAKENQKLRQLLKNGRQELNLSIRELAKEMNIHHAIIGKVETGDRQLNILEFVNYCKFVNLNPHEVLKQITQNTIY